MMFIPYTSLVVSLAATFTTFMPGFAESDQALIARALQRHKENDRNISSYTCRRTDTITTYGWFNRATRHQVMSESFQTPLRNVDVIYQMDGKSLPPAQIDQQRQKALEVMQQDEQASQMKLPSTALPEYEARRNSIVFSVYLLARHMTFTNRRLEPLQGRPTWKLDFQYDPSRPPQGKALSYVSRLHGQIWIDQADNQPVQVKAYTADSQGKEQEVFAQHHARQSNGKWLRSYLRFNPAANPDAFNGERFEWILTTSDYQEFVVEKSTLQQVRD